MSSILTGGVVLQQSGGGSGAASGVLMFVWLVLAVATIAGMWKTFAKAGEPGWAAIIPIYNTYIMLKIGGNAWWWLLLFLVPIVNIYAAYRMFKGVAAAFGRGLGFTLGLWFLGFVFFPLLGFGEYTFEGTPT